jgi:hypothetical protein
MRRTNQVLLWVGMGVLSLTPCALGRSIKDDYTALRGVSKITARADFMGLGGKSIFLDTDQRGDRTLGYNDHRSGHIETVEHDGHAIMPERNWGHGGNSGNTGNGPAPGSVGLQNGPGSGPGGDFVFNGPPPSGGGTSDAVNSFLPGGNNMPGGNTSVPEGGTSASYLVPAGFVAFGGIFLTGFRRRDLNF